MTQEDQYIPFVIARLFGGLLGGNAAALGADTVLALFFLPQRRRVVTVLNLSFLGGVVVGPTLSGFIVGNAAWPVQFWWSNGLEAIIIVLSLFFLEDTYYDRASNAYEQRKAWPDIFLAKRTATFLYHTRIISSVNIAESVCPVTLLCGGLTLVDFGFAAFFNIILTVFLQDPVSTGGYAFTPTQNAEFNYIIECFNDHASEAAAIMGLYRLALSLSVPFFAPAWIEWVGFGWCLGMAAFFSVLAYSSIIILIWKGDELRRWSFQGVASNNGGEKLIPGADSVEKV
ncbi:MAG: hypothetical protein Q9188_004425 [Gyalolechia gomerana]